MAAESNEYKLSTEIHGHKGDVRAVTTFTHQTNDYIVSASRDKTACIWKREGKDYFLYKKLAHHKGYVSSICVISKEDSSIVIATGSQDNSILIHSLEPSEQEPLERYSGHTSLVSCLIYQHSQLISASWDSTVRVWTTGQTTSSTILKAHEPAVWTLSGLYHYDGSHRFLSGGADKVIRLWEVSTSSCIQEYQGHSDVVRDIKVTSSDVFLSAANDCTIRQWNIHTGHCLKELFGHEAYVYSISLLPDGFASCGEDSTLRVWKGTDCIQVISLPCISVWAVSCTADGCNIVTGSSDSTIRVFTIDPSRMTSEQHQATFHSQIDEFKMSRNKDSIDVNTLPKMFEALSTPGQKTGDTKLVNNNGKAEVYQWDADSLQWVKIGDAVGQAPTNRKEYMGVEYDYLFDIEIDDGNSSQMRKLKLPYNKTDDPYVAAEKFMEINDIPAWYLDQIAEFIMKNADVQYVNEAVADPFTGGARYVPGLETTSDDIPQLGSGTPVYDPFTGGSRYRPSDMEPLPQSTGPTSSDVNKTNTHYPIKSYQFYSSSNDYITKIISKLTEFHQNNPQECAITDEEIATLNSLSASVISSLRPADLSHISLLTKLLSNWPLNCLFPILDIIRLVMLEESSAKYLTSTESNFINLLLGFACGPPPPDVKNQLLVLRIIANSFTTVNEWIHLQINEVFVIISQLLVDPSTLGKNQQTALVSIIINYSLLLSKSADENGVMELIQLILKVLSSPQIHNEGIYGSLISLGTLVSSKKDLVSKLPVNLNETLALLLERNDDKVSECAMLLLESIPSQM